MAAVLGPLVNDVAGRFGLGATATPLVREVLGTVASTPGGVSGFLDKMKSAGLGSEVSSWLGHSDAAALSAPQIDRALGAGTLGAMASRLGLGVTAVSTAVGYLLPRLIGALTPGGAVPSALTTEVTSFLSTPAAAAVPPPTARFVEQVPARHIEVFHDRPHMSRWLWPLLIALAVLGLGSYLLTANRTVAPVTPVAVQETVPPPAPVPAPTLPARLTLSNEDGVIHYSGSVHDEETRTSIINSLKAVFGADKIQGDIGLDLNAGAAPWLVNFRTALETFKVPGVQAVFDGNSLSVGGVSDAERDRMFASLRTILGSGPVFGSVNRSTTMTGRR